MMRKVVLGFGVLLFTWWLFCLPRPLFDTPLATVLLDQQGQLLSARIAADGQWRIPAADTISPKLAAAVKTFEDKRFNAHWGVDFKALGRAMRQNWRAGAVVSGGSTISMQVIRMASKNPPRTIWQKVLEAFKAWRLEWRYNKQEILQLWCNNAPFGGNVVGMEAAAWRYYGRSATELSWAEAATLAVLPNSPALIHPGRSRDALLAKRNHLLDRMQQAGFFTASDLALAKEEPLPEKPLALPRDAPHLLHRLAKEAGNGRHLTSIDGRLQREVNRLVMEHHRQLAGNEIQNLAVMVVDVKTGQTIAYVANVPDLDRQHSPDVDLITARRSPGSLLKPALYGLAMSQGLIAPKQFLTDIPTSFHDFNPANFNESFSGAVPADRALARSLNIPFVRLLQDYGVPKFHTALKEYGFDFLSNGPDHYGLSLILGGGEISMEQIAAWFTGLSRQQRFYHRRQGQYATEDWALPTVLSNQQRDPLTNLQQKPGGIDAGSGFAVLQALRELDRPDEEGNWQHFSSSRPVAWKTGTSFGFRDAWAVGASPNHVVAVWAGNADGEGRPGLIGVRAAAPVLFDVFRQLPRGDDQQWFDPPLDEMSRITTCQVTGRPAGPYCPIDTSFQPKYCERAATCENHEIIHTNQDQSRRTQLSCAAAEDVIATSWFTLTPAEAYFYQREHPEYRPLPPWSDNCLAEAGKTESPMQMVYPHSAGRIKPALDWQGSPTPFSFRLAHRYAEKKVHWHLDDQYVGTTQHYHSLDLLPKPGKHLLTMVDEDGYRLTRSFEVQ